MLYLVLFSTLAIGFYAATTTAVQIVGNERRIALAQVAAESGMEFIRYQLSQVTIPHGISPADLFPTVYAALETQLNGTGNISTIGSDGTIIQIPASPGSFVVLDYSGSCFRATIENMGAKVRVKVVGWKSSDNSVTRAVQMDYGLAEKASAIFDYGVASRGRITTAGTAIIKGATDPKKGSILSTCLTDPTPVSIGGKEVSGDISVTNPAANVYYSGASVGGTTDPVVIARDHIHKGVPEPEFPTIDTSIFEPFATNTYSTVGQNKNHVTLDNCRILANTNPSFTAAVTITGVLYIEAPNNVTFGGNLNVQGLIVVQNNPPGDLTTNSISFNGTVSTQGVSTLPSSYGDLKKLTGAFVLAPDFKVSFGGNFGTVAGSIIASQVNMTGNAGGTVMGSVINLEDTVMNVSGSSDITIASTGTTDYPAGVYFSSHYVPLTDTYCEVKP